MAFLGRKCSHHVIFVEGRMTQEQILLSSPVSTKVPLQVTKRTLLPGKNVDAPCVKLCVGSV